jgi:hypothetical protein
MHHESQHLFNMTDRMHSVNWPLDCIRSKPFGRLPVVRKRDNVLVICQRLGVSGAELRIPPIGGNVNRHTQLRRFNPSLATLLLGWAFLQALSAIVLAQDSDDIGIYRLEWVAGTVVHEGLLLLKGDRGLLRVRYFDETTNRQSIVQQVMEFSNSQKGTVLKGTNLIDVATEKEPSNYAADSFLIRTYPDGSRKIMATDADGTPLDAEAVEVVENTEFARLLKEFKWQSEEKLKDRSPSGQRDRR